MKTAQELEQIIENDATSLQACKAQAILNALNDYPAKFESLGDYIVDLKTKLGVSKISKEAIEKRLSGLQPQTDAWEMESLSELLIVFDSKNDLEVIIETL